MEVELLSNLQGSREDKKVTETQNGDVECGVNLGLMSGWGRPVG